MNVLNRGQYLKLVIGIAFIWVIRRSGRGHSKVWSHFIVGIGIISGFFKFPIMAQKPTVIINYYCCPLKVSEQRDIHPQCCCNGIADDFS